MPVDSVPRLDWGDGDNRGAVVSATVPATPARTLDQVPVGTVVSGADMMQMIQAEGVVPPSGLPAEIERDLRRSPEGYEAAHAVLTDSVGRVLSELRDPAGFARSFDSELLPSVRAKVLGELMRRPGIDFLTLLDRVEPTLTLAEAHSAVAFIRKHAGALR